MIRAPKPCSGSPTCPNEVEPGTSRCKDHQRARRRASDRRRPSARARGYDSRWERKRRSYLRTHPLCECGCGRPADDVHHLDGLGPTGPRGFEDSNLQALFHDCHSRITAREQPGGFNAR